jgi:hypothetical protein
VPAIIRGLAIKLRQEDETLSAEAIAAGIVEALGPNILGGDFIAPAPATIARHVRTALSATQDQKGASAGSS